MKRSPFKPKPVDPETGKARFSTFKTPTKPSFTRDVSPLLRSKPMERQAMKRRPRRARKGDDKAYLAFIRLQRCVVLDRIPCKRAVPHHAIEMGGEELAGMASTADDSQTVPLCPRHHRQFHLHQGFCAGWSKEQRRVFQQDEIDRLNAIWTELLELGVLQEPMRKAI